MPALRELEIDVGPADLQSVCNAVPLDWNWMRADKSLTGKRGIGTAVGQIATSSARLDRIGFESNKGDANLYIQNGAITYSSNPVQAATSCASTNREQRHAPKERQRPNR